MPNRPRTRLHGSIRYRLCAALVAVVGVGVMAIAGYIEPDPRGLGSHRQLQLPACGFYQRTGYPCPTCGMTTAFSHIIRGHFYRGFASQPAGALAAVLGIMGTLAAIYAGITGRRWDRFFTLIHLHWAGLMLLAGAVVLASWLYLCLITWRHS